MAGKLTEEMFEDGMTRAEMVACSPGNDRCYPFTDPIEDVRASCTPKGRRRIGVTRRVIVANSGRDSWEMWLDVHTGERRLRRQAH
jgi:hypothetical protein